MAVVRLRFIEHREALAVEVPDLRRDPRGTRRSSRTPSGRSCAQMPRGRAEVGDARLGADTGARQHDARSPRVASAPRALDAHRMHRRVGPWRATHSRRRFASASRIPTRRASRTTPSYLVWFEVARVEYLRAYAGGYQALRDHGIEALVLESHCRYVVPAVFDDLLHVHTRCVGLRGARFRYEYAIVRDDGTLMADGYTESRVRRLRQRSSRRACRTGSGTLLTGLSRRVVVVVVVVVVVASGFAASSSCGGPIRTSFGTARYDEYQVSW